MRLLLALAAPTCPDVVIEGTIPAQPMFHQIGTSAGVTDYGRTATASISTL